MHARAEPQTKAGSKINTHYKSIKCSKGRQV